MGQNHWKQADAKPNLEPDFLYELNRTTVGLFTRCVPAPLATVESCFPNLYPGPDSPCFSWTDCQPREYNATCQCDYLPSTKATAACAIIAAIFLGLAVILLFLQSISSSESRILGLLFGFVPLILLFLAFVFMLITLILVGSFLSRDVIHIGDTEQGTASTHSSNVVCHEPEMFVSVPRTQSDLSSTTCCRTIQRPHRRLGWLGNRCLDPDVLLIRSLHNVRVQNRPILIIQSTVGLTLLSMLFVP